MAKGVYLDETALAKLAREIVMNIRNYKVVFADYGIDEEDYYEIEKNEFFKKVKEHFAQEWNSALSTKDRLEIEAQAYCEQLMPVATRRALDPETPLPAVNEVLKTLQKIATGEKSDGKAAADRFVISINLGGEVETFNKAIAVDANDVGGKEVKQLGR